MFQIAEDKRSFLRNERPTFYLADTCWSAFTNITEEDWDYYLEYRKSQGFNVIQVNMLWQWDSSETTLNYLPFEKDEDGNFIYDKRNNLYFDRAERMIKKAYEKGITVALVLLWANYIPNTWASQMGVKRVGLFPKQLVEPYVTYVVKRYDCYNPIYVISGDTDFQTEEVVKDYYGKALAVVKSLNPKAVTTLHIRGRLQEIPNELIADNGVDFYMYQSGHNQNFPNMGYQLAEHFYQKEPTKPVLNSEPCYEMMGFSHREYGRFTRQDVRRVAWQSVLSGAHAGITYGAHGIWSWHNESLVFDSSVGEAFETPYDWHDALRFDGAWDYGYIRHFIEKNNLLNLLPQQNLLMNAKEKLSEAEIQFAKTATHLPKRTAATEIRVAESKDKIVVYIPSAIKVKLKGNLLEKIAYFINLENHLESPAFCQFDSCQEVTIFDMYKFVGDALLVIDK